MKHSHVFKTFSDSILLPSKSEGDVLVFHSNENTPTEMTENNKKELMYLEAQLHMTRIPRKNKKDQVIIIAPSYGNPENFEKVIDNGLFTDSATSSDVENKEAQKNIEKNSKINVKTAKYFVPETQTTHKNNKFSDRQWESNLENETQQHYHNRQRNNRKKKFINEKKKKNDITLLIPVSTTIRHYTGYKGPAANTANKHISHFFDEPFNRIEEISKEDAGVLVLR